MDWDPYQGKGNYSLENIDNGGATAYAQAGLLPGRREPRPGRGRGWVLAAALLLVGLMGTIGVTSAGAADAAPYQAPAVSASACPQLRPAPTVACPALVHPVVTLASGAPPGPFSSGQLVTTTVGPHSILHQGKRIFIRECAAQGGNIPTSPNQCDLRTTHRLHVFAGPRGRVVYQGYPIFALPDTTVLGEKAKRTSVCDLTHPCALFIGRDRTDFDQPHVWSLPFSVSPNAGDTGADPGNGLPEAPAVVALPALALTILGGFVWLRRRRAATGSP